MNMKDHILIALKEQIDRWEELLDHMSDKQINSPLMPSNWSTKDVLSHLRTWQQRSIARLEAALSDREPIFPKWLPELDPDSEGDTERTNAWIYGTHRHEAWPIVRQNWRDGYNRFIELGKGISEKDILDESRFPWM